ncbi:MAG: hypothetical protein AAFO82_23335, partial [Bacteroidota bacterium]
MLVKDKQNKTFRLRKPDELVRKSDKLDAFWNMLGERGYYESLGIPPGPPTIPGYYAQPEINATSLPNATNQNPYTAPPT